MKNVTLIIVIILSLVLVTLATRVQAQETPQAADYAMNGAEVRALAGEAFMSDDLARGSAEKAAAIRALEGGCVDLEWLLSADSPATSELSARVLTVYSAMTPREFSDGENPDCFDTKGLAWAIMDNVVDISETGTTGYSLRSVDPINISGNALASAIVRKSAIEPGSGASVSLAELDANIGDITGHHAGFVRTTEVKEHITNFSDEPEAEGTSGGPRFSWFAIASMFNIGYIHLGEKDGPGSIDEIDKNTDVTLTHFLSPHDIQTTGYENHEDQPPADDQAVTNQYLGVMNLVDGDYFHPVRYLFKPSTVGTMGLQDYWEVAAEGMKLRKIILKFLFKSLINNLADSLVNDRHISELGHDFIEKSRTYAQENQDPLSITFLMIAFGLPSEARVSMVEGVAANQHLVENIDPHANFAHYAAISMQIGYAKLWDGGTPPDDVDPADFVSPDDYVDNGNGGDEPETVENIGNTGTQKLSTSVQSKTTSIPPDLEGRSGILNEDRWAAFAEKRAVRLDYALEFVVNTGDLAGLLLSSGNSFATSHVGFESMYQLRFFWTHPKRLGDGSGRYYSEVRIRLYDEAGFAGNTQTPSNPFDLGETNTSAEGANGWLWAGMLGLHDLIIPITFEADWSLPERGDTMYRSSYNGVVQGGISGALAKFKTSGNGTGDAASGGTTPPNAAQGDAVAATGSSLLKKAFENFNTVKIGTGIEMGVGYGVAFTYNLSKIEKANPWYLFALILTWVVGVAAGAWIGSFALAEDFTNLFNAQQAVAAAHIGPEVGWAFADWAASKILNNRDPDLVEIERAGFVWVAAFPFTAGAPAIYFRGRLQFNWDFLVKKI